MFRSKEFINAIKTTLDLIDYVYLEPMNKNGEWAELYFIYSKEAKEIRVAKVYSEPLGRINEEIYKSDAKKLININHQNVVKIFDKGFIEYKENKYFYLILEYIRGKSLEEIDNSLFLEIPYNERLNFFAQTLEGINEFRKNFDLHRDLHTANIMLSEEYEIEVRKIKIIDPGSSRYFYKPIEGDIDYYLVKKDFLNFYLRPEEIKAISENIDLNTLNFPKFKELIDKLNVEESEISSKTMEKKNLDVTIYEPLVLDTNKQYIVIKAVNKGLRPIVITNYGFRSVKYGTIINIYNKKLVRKHLLDRLPKKLSDGEACIAFYPKKKFELSMKSTNWKFPFELLAYFNTNDGTYYSKKYILREGLYLDAKLFRTVNHEKLEKNK